MENLVGYKLGDDNEPSKIIKPKKNKSTIKNKSAKENIFFIVDDIVYFALKGRAEKDSINAFVSLDKWPNVSKYDWYLGKDGYPQCYQLGKMKLHRFIFTLIMGQYPPSELYVDHIDRNKLNNTNFNLRLATPQENSFNKSTKTNTKGIKKISEGNYSAVITKNGIKHEIKNISTEKDAALTYNMMAEELFGSFAAPNRV